MSNGARYGIIILLVIMLAAVVYGGWTTIQNVQIKQDKEKLQKDLVKSQESEKRTFADLSALKDQIKRINDDKSNLENQLQEARKQVQGYTSQVKEISDDRDRWQKMVESARKERDDLMAKVQELSAKQAEMTAKTPEEQTSPTATTAPSSSTTAVAAPAPAGENTEYWADVLKQKATLEVELQRVKDDLSKSSVQLVDLKQKNADLQSQLDNLNRAKDVVGIETKYKEEVVNNLSLELARAKNDKKYLSEKFSKFNEENEDLRKQLQQLLNAKSALEKSVVQLTQDKEKLQGELGKAETLVQSKIDEIWEIKESLDKTIQSSKSPASANQVELPPIIVNSPGQSSEFNAGAKEPGFNGKIVSINEENNFVIVDLGEASGIKVGDVLGVYRGDKYIARIEVIQVRKDISAADLKDQWSKIKVGDTVR